MEGVDRLNELKDEILVNNIMSRLDCTTKEIIRTTATISKRWKNLWTQLPHLIFSYENDGINYFTVEEDLHGYISFIDNTLNQCPTDLKLEKFKLDICVNNEFKSRANRWIRYAISRNVEEVDLRLWDVVVGPFNFDDELFFDNLQLWDVPVGQEFTYEDELFFNTSCITRMTLSFCRFNPPNGAISWERLECLCLLCANLDEDMIEKILSGSPCLESLQLNDCYGYRRIDITSKRVKKLVFSGYNSHRGISAFDEAYIDCVKIDAPYISSITIKAELVLRELVLLNVSSLVEAHLDYSMDSWIFNNKALRGLLESLGHLEYTTFGDHCSELLSRLKAGIDTSASKISVTMYERPKQEIEVHFRDPKQYEDYQVTVMDLELIANAEALNQYNPIFYIKRAKSVIDEARRWEREAQRKLTGSVDGCFSVGINCKADQQCEKDVDRIKKQFDDWMAFLHRWALMTLLNPVLSVENLVYIGYAGDPSSAVRVTRKRRVDRKKQHSDQKMFRQCLILREIPEDAIEKLLVNKEALGACDMAVFVHDSSKEASWIRATELLVQVASHGESNGYEVPCLIVAAKDDLELYPNAIEALTGVSQDMGIQAPIPISTKLGDFNNVFKRTVAAAEHPHLSIPETDADKTRKWYHSIKRKDGKTCVSEVGNGSNRAEYRFPPVALAGSIEEMEPPITGLHVLVNFLIEEVLPVLAYEINSQSSHYDKSFSSHKDLPIDLEASFILCNQAVCNAWHLVEGKYCKGVLFLPVGTCFVPLKGVSDVLRLLRRLKEHWFLVDLNYRVGDSESEVGQEK
ncbi:mitochondrial Rho GTPase 1-like protein [Tanacetum coccineum]